MSKKDEKLDAAARKLYDVAGPVGDVIANAVLRPFRGDSPCTCGDRKHKH